MNCPKCGVKIKPYDWRQNCKKCDANIFLYEFDKRLEHDSVQAEIDFKWWTDMTDNFMKYGFRDKLGLVRFILSVLPLVFIPAPVVEYNGKTVMMLKFMLDVLGGEMIFPKGFGIGDTAQYAGLAPAMLMLVLSIAIGVFGFFATLIGPAFLKFKTRFSYITMLPLAIIGTTLFNFVFVPDYVAQNGANMTASFGLYIYIAVIIADLVVSLKAQKHFSAVQLPKKGKRKKEI